MTAIQDVASLLVDISAAVGEIQQKQKDARDANRRHVEALALAQQYRDELDVLLAAQTASLKQLRDALVAAFGAAG